MFDQPLADPAARTRAWRDSPSSTTASSAPSGTTEPKSSQASCYRSNAPSPPASSAPGAPRDHTLIDLRRHRKYGSDALPQDRATASTGAATASATVRNIEREPSPSSERTEMRSAVMVTSPASSPLGHLTQIPRQVPSQLADPNPSLATRLGIIHTNLPVGTFRAHTHSASNPVTRTSTALRPAEMRVNPAPGHRSHQTDAAGPERRAGALPWHTRATAELPDTARRSTQARSSADW